MSKFIEFVDQKFPTVFHFVVRRTSRFLRHFFPYKPTVVGEEKRTARMARRPTFLGPRGGQRTVRHSVLRCRYGPLRI